MGKWPYQVSFRKAGVASNDKPPNAGCKGMKDASKYR